RPGLDRLVPFELLEVPRVLLRGGLRGRGGGRGRAGEADEPRREQYGSDHRRPPGALPVRYITRRRGRPIGAARLVRWAGRRRPKRSEAGALPLAALR